MNVKQIVIMCARLQTWKKEFEGTILINNDPGQRGKLDQQYTISLGNYKLHVESTSETKISGYYEFSFQSDDLSVNQAEEEAKNIEKEIFQTFFQLVDLKNIQFEIKWGELKAIGFTEGTKFTVSKSFSANSIICGPSAPISKDQVQYFEYLFKKLDTDPRKGFLLNLLHLTNLNTSRPSEDFFYKWVAFNQIFRELGSGNQTEVDDLKNFSKICPDNSELSTIFKNHDAVIAKLSSESLTNRSGTENYSKRLATSISQSNNRDVWLYTILCIYVIRNNLFHEGKELSYLKDVNKILKDIVRVGILFLLK